MKYERLTIALDMHGCPNRCRHCWLGWGPNAGLGPEDLRFVAEAFRPHTQRLIVYDWYREPDMTGDYRELWQLCGALSTPGEKRDHFELASVPRLARDRDYPQWLRSLGVNVVQLTFFGGEEVTNRMSGRPGAYQDLLTAIERLLENGLAPRIQVFVNKSNLDQLPFLDQLIDRLALPARCQAVGKEFVFFLHQGSCDGKNRDFYPQWLTPEDLEKIPPRLAAYSLKHWGAADLWEVFGRPEGELVEELLEDPTTQKMAQTEPVLYIDSSFSVYPNFTAPSPHWLLGNLKAPGRSPEENAGAALEFYAENRSPGQHARATVPVGELARCCGDRKSRRLFCKGDYIDYLLGRYLERTARQGN